MKLNKLITKFEETERHIEELKKIEDEKDRIINITQKQIKSIMVNKKKKYDQMMDPGSAMSRRSKRSKKSKGSLSASFKKGSFKGSIQDASS